MQIRSIAFLSLRILSIYLFIQGMIAISNIMSFTIPSLLGMIDRKEIEFTSYVLVILISSVLFFILSSLLWIYSSKLSTYMTPNHDNVDVEESDITKLQVTGFSLVGIVVLVTTVPEFIRQSIQLLIVDQSLLPGMKYNIDVVYPLIETGLKAIIGIVLLFQAEGVVGLIKKIREIGTIKKE